MWRSTDDGWMHASSSGSMTMRPAARSSRMVRSDRITAGTLAQRARRPSSWRAPPSGREALVSGLPGDAELVRDPLPSHAAVAQGTDLVADARVEGGEARAGRREAL